MSHRHLILHNAALKTFVYDTTKALAISLMLLHILDNCFSCKLFEYKPFDRQILPYAVQTLCVSG